MKRISNHSIEEEQTTMVKGVKEHKFYATNIKRHRKMHGTYTQLMVKVKG
jgi:hypothetical protein